MKNYGKAAASAAEKARMRDDTALHITGKRRQAAGRSNVSDDDDGASAGDRMNVV